MMSRQAHITNLRLSLLVNALFFCIALLLLHPVYDTVEDVYLLYQLSGGFGAAPTALLHYNHILHPVLGYPISLLFRVTDKINWYSFSLVGAQFIAGVQLLLCLLRKRKRNDALLLYGFFFVVFALRFLLRLQFSGTAIMLGMAGLLRIILANGPDSRKDYITGAALLLAGSLFRIHVLLPLFPLALPFLFSKPGWPERRRAVYALFASCLLIAAMHLIQLGIYTTWIPGWKAEEAYRQELYHVFNHRNIDRPEKPGDPFYEESNALHYGLFIDSSSMPASRLHEFYNAGYKQGASVRNGQLYWFLMNGRLYFLAFAICFLFLDRKGRLMAIAAFLMSLLLGASVIYFYSKLPGYLFLCLLGFPAVATISCGGGSKETPLWRMLPLFLLALWSLVLLRRVDRQVVHDSARFRIASKEMAAHPDYLFLSSPDEFPLQKYPAFEAPSLYPLANFLGGEHFLLRLEKPTLQGFRVSALPDLPGKDHILISEKPLPFLQAILLARGIKTSALPANFPVTHARYYSLKMTP